MRDYNILMNLITHPGPDEMVVEISADSILLKNEQDAIRLLEEIFASGSSKIIIHQENIAPEFFDLRTRLAGAILQKFVNYQIQIAIIGNFTNIPSDSLKAFIYESNKGKHVFFLESVEQAIQKFKS